MATDEPEKQDPEKRINAYILKATPRVFEWFGWIAALGATQFVYAKTKSHVVFALMLAGYISLFLYTHALLGSWIKFSSIKTAHHREFVSGLTALFLAYTTFYVAQQAITAFSLSAL